MEMVSHISFVLQGCSENWGVIMDKRAENFYEKCYGEKYSVTTKKLNSSPK